MSAAELYIDRGFRPDIKVFSISGIDSYFEAFQIPSIGLPAPVLDRNRKAAIWIGEVPTSGNEVPVLAVSMGSKQKLDTVSKYWYFGAACASLAQDARSAIKDGIASEDQLADIAVRSAVHGTHKPYDAGQLLQSFLPIDSVAR